MARFLIASALAVHVAADESIVNTPLGSVQGAVFHDYREFRGVPYASQPVGAARWEAPQAATPWTGVLNTTIDPPGCIQHCGEPPRVCPASISEACLFLNVFTPRVAAMSEPAPVLVFIHGGNFKDAFCGGPLYNGASLASRTGVISVSINYRLGVLGFLQTAGDTSHDPYAITGNYGLLDQRQALLWVQQNIAAFGGDPKRVTLSGQSAGAMSVASHLTSPLSAGLFSAAIMQSEPFALPFRAPASAQSTAAAFANFTGCGPNNTAIMNGSITVGQCLRALSTDAVLAGQLATQADLATDLSQILQVFMPWTPVYNTPVLPTWPILAFQAGQVHDVPVMAGITESEGTMFIYGGFPGNISVTEYYALLPVIFGLSAGLQIAARYPAPSPAPPDLRPQAANITTAAIFKCATRNATRTLAAAPGRRSPVYMYQFDHVLSWGKEMWVDTAPYCWNMCCHGDDLPFVWFPNLTGIITQNYTAAEGTLALEMESYWGSFVHTGVAGNGTGASGGLPALTWPTIDNGRSAMHFTTPSNNVLSPAFDDDCDFWDTVGYSWY